MCGGEGESDGGGRKAEDVDDVATAKPVYESRLRRGLANGLCWYVRCEEGGREALVSLETRGGGERGSNSASAAAVRPLMTSVTPKVTQYYPWGTRVAPTGLRERDRGSG